MAKAAIRKIWVLDSNSGSSGKALLYCDKKSRKRKKQLAVLKPVERGVRMGAKSGEKFFSTYLKKQNKSNRKRKNGWVIDFPVNAIRAGTKGVRAFKLPKLIGM